MCGLKKMLYTGEDYFRMLEEEELIFSLEWYHRKGSICVGLWRMSRI